MRSKLRNERSLRYLASLGWVDLICILPFYAGLATAEPFRFQVLRLLLLLKMTRFTPALGTLGRVLSAEWRSLISRITRIALMSSYGISHSDTGRAGGSRGC